MRPTRRLASLVLLASGVSACNPKLPEPESPGARLYAERCSECHRLSEPRALKFEMWKYQVERMQGEMTRRGVPPLSSSEVQLLLDYLRRHAG